MADNKELIKEQIAKLQEIDIDELSDEDLDDVAGGEICGCSCWCCSSSEKEVEIEVGAE